MEIIQDDAKKLVQVWLSRKEAAEIYGGGISLRAGGFEGEYHGTAGV